jgi:succinate-acetate transporter protein/CBS domain-containing protein
MLVKEVMSRSVDEIPADAPLTDAIDKLERMGQDVVAVIDEGQVLGTITEHDVAAWRARAGDDPAMVKARDVLVPRKTFLSEDQDVREAAKMMKEAHIGGMVVLKDQQPVGTVSLAELATRVSGNGFAATSPLPARVFLQPIAAPSIMGFFALATGTFLVGSQMAGWYGTATTPEYLFPFVALFGGLGQLLACMWAYRARDGLATAIHGVWGSFFAAYGLLYWLIAAGTLSIGALQPGYGYWFVALAAITGVFTIAAVAENGAMTLQQAALTLASAILAISLLQGSGTWVKVGGWCMLVSGIVAWYLASALLFEGTYRRVVLPLGRMRMMGNNRPGSLAIRPIEYQFGEPGVRMGQ